MRYWDYSTFRLTGNLTVWLATLATAGLAWQWVLHRYRPRLRWSLRTMLAVVAGAAALCAWCVVERDRANEQDALLESSALTSDVYFERWGPKWLDLVGADRFRRRIVAAEFDTSEENDTFFERLTKLGSVRLLDVNPWSYGDSFVFTPRMAVSLGEMRQLRVLAVNCWGKNRNETKAGVRECLAAIGKLTQLERLRLEMREEDAHELACLGGLTNLKTLSLKIDSFHDAESFKRMNHSEVLEYLPPLPRLEALDLDGWRIGGEHLNRLDNLPKLKSLNLSATMASGTDLAKLGSLDSLEELGISESLATATAFESLAALKHLRAIHIELPTDERVQPVGERLILRAMFLFDDAAEVQPLHPATLPLDDGHELPVLSEELDGLNRALATLRRSHPGIVIDADYESFLQRVDRLQPDWVDDLATDKDMRRLLKRW